jgi:hypothetical protein
MAITDRAQENMEYVRTLLKKNQPEFAALLECFERELPYGLQLAGIEPVRLAGDTNDRWPQ